MGYIRHSGRQIIRKDSKMERKPRTTRGADAARSECVVVCYNQNADGGISEEASSMPRVPKKYNVPINTNKQQSWKKKMWKLKSVPDLLPSVDGGVHCCVSLV